MEQIQKQKKKDSTTIYIDKDLIASVRALIYLKKSRGEKVTITEFFEEAIKEKLRKEGMDI